MYRFKISPLWPVALVVPLVMQLIQFSYMRNFGVLRNMVLRDDGYTIARVQKHWDLFEHAETPANVVRTTSSLWIHSPFADFQAMIGLALSGNNIYVPILFNFWCLALVLFAIIQSLHASPKRSWLAMAAIGIVVVSQPLAWVSLQYMKADYKGGLFVAVGLLLLKLAVDRNSSRLKFVGAAALSAAALAKMTAFYVPVLLIGVLVVFELYGILRRLSGKGEGAPQIWSFGNIIDWKTFGICAAIVVLPYAAFFAISAQGYIDYIKFATTSDYWKDGLTLAQRVLYYTPLSTEGAQLWGLLYILFGGFSLLALGMAVVCKDYTFPALFVMLVVTIAVFYAPLAIAQSNMEYASTMIGVVLGATLVAMQHVLARTNTWQGGAVLASVAAAALLTHIPLNFNPPTYGGMAPFERYSAREMKQLGQAFTDIAVAVDKHDLEDRPTVAFFFDHTAAHQPNLSIKYFGMTGFALDEIPAWNYSPQEMTRTLTDADFIVTAVPSDGGKTLRGLNLAFISGRDSMRGEACAQALPGISRIGAYPVPGGEFRLYKLPPAGTLKLPAPGC